jgi:hypothetical protein
MTLSVVDYREVQFAKALGIGDHVHLHYLSAGDCKAECPEQLSVRSQYESNRSVNQRGLCEPGGLRKGNRAPGPIARASDLGSSRRRGKIVGPDENVRVEHGNKPFKITSPQCCEEGVGD